MKKIIAALVVTLSLASCNDDDDNKDMLVGTWFPESTVINGIVHPYEGNASCGQDRLELREFNSFVITDYKEGDGTETVPCTSEKYYGSYAVVNNELKFYGSSFFQGGTIIEKTSSRLQVKRMMDVNGDGTVDEIAEVFIKHLQE